MLKQKTFRWIALVTAVLALILVPFMLFGEKIEVWTEHFVQTAADNPVLTGTVLSAMLASDILVPIPSSMVSTTAGFVLGFMPGMLASLIGMAMSCVLGFVIGLRWGRPAALRFVGAQDLQNLENLRERFGDWAIIIARPVPVLAEASILFAGISRMPWSRFLLLTTLSNLGVSAVYAAVGAFSSNANSFLLAFGGAILIPWIAMLATRRGRSLAKVPVETQDRE
ncbi:MAG: VTT domain-containing protein [Anaerolineae bacterium]|nr:VTT domain-containing protein [Anaerolineae bacterium]